MWTQFGPSAFYLLRVGTLWDQALGVKLCRVGRLGTWTNKSQADEFDRHTTNCHTVIWPEFRLPARFNTSNNHIQTTMITVMRGHHWWSLFNFSYLLEFWAWAKYISDSNDHGSFSFPFAILTMGEFISESSGHGKLNPRSSNAVSFLSGRGHGFRATRS